MGKLVNVGCGVRVHPAWINLDLHALVPGVVACDLTQGLPLAEEEAQAVYTAAVLEHIRPDDVPDFLRECRRVLERNGHFRIAVPNFESQVTAYLDCLSRLDQGDVRAAADHEWMLVEIFDQTAREKSGGKMGEYLAEPTLPNEDFIVKRIGKEGSELIAQVRKNAARKAVSTPKPRPVKWGKLGEFLLKRLLDSKSVPDDLRSLEIGRFRLQSGEVHQWAYDRQSLRRTLEKAGFRDVRVCEHGVSEIPGWEEFQLEVDSSGYVEKPDLLILEARK